MKTSSTSSALLSSFHRVRACAPRWLAAGIAGLMCFNAPDVIAQHIWNLGTGGSWNVAGNWTPPTVPNAIGESITLNGAATGSNPQQTANRTITLDGAQTVGSILFNNDLGAFTNSLTTGAAGSLTLDELGAGPAIITTSGGGTGNNTISAPITLADSLVAIVNNTTATSAAGSLNLTATMTGPGGFTKLGDGLATFGTGLKNYTGATLLAGGRMRMSQLAHPTLTSGMTIGAGAQLTLITNNGTFGFGAGPLHLNGAGPTTGPFAAFPGAIRNDTNLIVTITNSIVLDSDTLLHVQGSATGLLTLSGAVSGTGMLSLTAPGSDANLGRLVLGGDNSYTGGTFVRGGTLSLGSAGADFGLGDVTVASGNLMFPGASARLQIPSGTLNAIADTATLFLAGGNVFGVPDDGAVELQSGINEIVGGLLLGGVPQPFGTYGSTSSGATFQNDEYFSGTGTLTVVPEPASAVMLAGGFGALLGLRRRRGWTK